MMMTQPQRRRVEDWKEKGEGTLPLSSFTSICLALGYNPQYVMSVRMNPYHVVVTYKDQAMGGMPRSKQHDMVSSAS